MNARTIARASLTLTTVSLVTGCFGLGPSTSRDELRANDEAVIRQSDLDWAKAAQAKDVSSWLAFYASDAVVLPPNDKLATGHDAIAKTVRDLLTLPALTIDWQPLKIEAAESRDLAYAYGSYQLSYKDDKGKVVSDHGKYVEVWKRQPSGGWRCVVDTWNSDLPP